MKTGVKRILVLPVLAFCVAGCVPSFAYKPNPPQEGPRLPIKVAVLAFEDGTDNFTKRGSLGSGYVFNLAKTGINGWTFNTGAAYNVSALTPALWAKSLAEDMGASGNFQAVRLIFSPSELTDEDLLVKGVVTKAYFQTGKEIPDEFAIHLSARKRTDKSPLWERDVRRSSLRPRTLTSGCLTLGDCIIERIHSYLNGVMQGMFQEARLDLVQAIASDGKPEQTPPGQELPEDIIRRILGKP